MAITTTNPTSAATASALLGTSGGSKSTALSDANASQDRFLKLLVAQLNNQDPMNPMDNAQMTSQMAQINTVSGIQQLNETMKSMSSQFSALQTLQGMSMIGRDVLVEGKTLSIKDGLGRGAVDLPLNADKVTVQIFSPSGQPLETINLGALKAGRTTIEWDASKYTGTGDPTFKVTASYGGKAVSATTLSRETVTSVSNTINGISLELKGMYSVGYDAIKAIL